MKFNLFKISLIIAFSFLLGTHIQAQKTANKTNILFCIADDASMKSFGPYGDVFIKTPSIDKLAEEGVVFNNAYNCNPKCAPARASIVTGMYSWQLKEAANHYPKMPTEFKFYPHILMEKGYEVGYTGKGWGPGSYEGEHNPAGPEYNQIKSTPPYKGMSSVDYAANFESFLTKNNDQKPFCFWLGTFEPHRFYEEDSWKKENKKLSDAVVPPFFPDNEIIRGDILDYAVEVEWFDTHVGKAIKILEDKGLLENTLVVITSDHGMPFPRIKGQVYEEGFHVPLICYWKGRILPKRVVEDFVNFPDLAPTFMKIAGFNPDIQMSGKSFEKQLFSKKSGQIDRKRNYALLGKERHDIGRSNEDGVDLGYPVRAIRNKDFLYVHNIKPERWPVGNPEYDFRNTDASPTKTYITKIPSSSPEHKFWELNFGKRPEEELYDMKTDPNCMFNLANDPKYAKICKKMRAKMEAQLIKQGDPRTLGNGDIFDKYKYYGKQFDYETGKSIK